MSYVRRSDATATSGCVAWPAHLRPAHCGCFVVAVFTREPHDLFVRCLDLPNVVLLYVEHTSPACVVDPIWPWVNADPASVPRSRLGREDESVRVLAAVTLGSCGSGFLLPGEGVASWAASRSDLTGEGEAIVSALERLYGRPALLLTFIDT